MCSSPSIPAAQQYQASQSPVYRDRAGQAPTGRRSTVLTGGSSSSTNQMQELQPGVKKTALGQ